MSDEFFKVANIGLTVVIEALLARESSRQVISKMIEEGRSRLTDDEIAAMAAESEEVHAQFGAAIAQAKAEGR